MRLKSLNSVHYIKEDDTFTPIQLQVIGYDDKPFDLSEAEEIVVKIGTSDGMLAQKKLSDGTLTRMEVTGGLEFRLDVDDQLVRGANFIEVQGTINSKKFKAPSKGYYKLNIEKSMDSIGQVVTKITLDYFIEKVDEKIAELQDKIDYVEETREYFETHLDETVDLAVDNKMTPFVDEVSAHLAQKVDQVTFNVANQQIEFYANGILVRSVDISEAGNAQAVQSYIDSLVSEGFIEGVTLADGAVTYDKVNFSDEISIRAKNIQLNGNFAVESSTPGVAEGWVIGSNVASSRIENNAQYWMPTGTYNSSALSSRTWGWGAEAIAGHKYYVSFEQNNVGTFRIVNDPDFLLNISENGKQSLIYTPSTSRTFDVRFVPRSANVETSVQNVIVVDLTETFGAGNEPEADYFQFLLRVLGVGGWFGGTINLTDASKNGIVTAKDLKIYDPEGLLNADNVNDALLELKKNLDSGGGYDPEPLYQLSLIDSENKRLYEELEVLRNNAQKALNAKIDKPSDRQEISLRENTRQKLILHLHKRENDGYDTVNDVYLPNAEDDFSDIRITNDKGEVLPYQVTYYADDFDIVVDSRLGYGYPTSQILIDSSGKWYRVFDHISVSDDEGKTWSEIPALSSFLRPEINLITFNDTLLFNRDGVLYRSEPPYSSYTQVFDLTDFGKYAGALIVGKGMVQHPDGEIFFGAYQTDWHIRFYKSTDDGLTWELSADFGNAYQHVHGMYVDRYSSPVAIYAGVDGGGGVYKTTDKGNTWVDLRAQNPNMPQATDYGVRYADPSGYRLLGGETPVVGGHSIIKTEDDVNFRPVLSSGISVNYIEKMNGKLFATGSGDRAVDVGAVLVSNDEGETWETAYLTSPVTPSSSVNDGYRYMTKLDGQILVGPQSGAVPYLRILSGGKYAEIVVDVPDGSNSIIVESGYAYTNIKPIYNDVENLTNDYLVKFNLNEGGRVIKESVSGKYFEGDFEWQEIGKHLSYFYPYIISPDERLSVSIKSLNGYTIDSSHFDVSEGATISFWARMDKNIEVELFNTDLGDTFKLIPSTAGFRTELNGSYRAQTAVNVIPGAFQKIDITIDQDGEVEVYNNGLKIRGIRKYNSGDVLTAINNSSEMTFLNTINSEDSYCMQHFSVRKGVVSADQIMAEYHSFISNNLF